MAVLGGTPAVLGGTYQATASGAIANGDPVKINSNGTVSKAIGVDGASMYCVTGTQPDAVYHYILKTPFDIMSASFHETRVIGFQELTPTGITFNNDGTKFFLSGETGDDINEYAVSSPYDLTTASFTDAFSVASQETFPRKIAFNDDGSKIFLTGRTGDDVNEYTLSTNYDISTASFVDSFDVSGKENQPNGVAFNTDGTKMFVSGQGSKKIHEYALSTGFDVSTASYTDYGDIAATTQYPTGLAFSTDGTKVFHGDEGMRSVSQYTLGTGFDISTIDLTTAQVLRANTRTPASASTAGTFIFPDLCFGDGPPSQASYIGLASAAASDGATATIQVMGSIDDAASGLTAGMPVYVSLTGTLTSTRTPLIAGTALTASKVLIKGAYSELFT